MTASTPVRRRSRASHALDRADERKAIKGWWARAEGYHQQNLKAAGIVLEREQEFGGPTAGLVKWARLVLRHEAEKQAAAA